VVVVLLAGDGLIVAGINDGVDGVMVLGGGGTGMRLPIEERS
jgi:dihydrodipicolinate synthase/N-acetylneuraminate lyase